MGAKESKKALADSKESQGPLPTFAQRSQDPLPSQMLLREPPTPKGSRDPPPLHVPQGSPPLSQTVARNPLPTQKQQDPLPPDQLLLDPSLPSQTPQGPIFVAIHDCEARLASKDLSFKKGEKLQILTNAGRETDDGWLARSLETHREGYIQISSVQDENLENEEWFAGFTTRAEAERLLDACQVKGAFLVRVSEVIPEEYGLSIQDIEKIRHYRVKRTEQAGYLITRRAVFQSLKDLVTHYQQDSDGLCTNLRMPCPRGEVSRSLKEELEWEIHRYQIRLIRRLGNGQFSNVWEGLWNNTTRVAVKTPKPGSDITEFLHQADIMKVLYAGPKHMHPNLLVLYALVTESEPLWIVTELMSKGNLLEFLRQEGRLILKLPELIDMAAQVASGMAYMELQHCIHRDLAARNILVGEGNICKIADFSCAQLLSEQDIYTAPKGERVAPKWQPPEVLLHKRYSIKSDVWSFGIVLYEVITYGMFPYPEINNAQVVQEVDKGYRMPRPASAPEQLYQVMLDCWKEDPYSRPTFETLQWLLEEFFTAGMHLDNKPDELRLELQPKDVTCTPGEKAELSVKANAADCSYQWFVKHPKQDSDLSIPTTNVDYEGPTTDHLCIKNCLSKHEGAYKCLVTNQSGTTVTSDEAHVKTFGELIGLAECKLLGAILQTTDIDLTVYGIDIQVLLDGTLQLTYEEVQFIMRGNSSTQILSKQLKTELISRLEEERLYREAMAKDHKISLSYTKILALGPGQVGKSTFLYRLMGIMKGNIQTSDPGTQPQSSTGIAELHEACIKYTSRTGALTDKNWHVFEESMEIQSQLNGLIKLLSKQMQGKKLKTIAEEPQKVSSLASPGVSDIIQSQSNEDTNVSTSIEEVFDKPDDSTPVLEVVPDSPSEQETPSESLLFTKELIVPRKQNIYAAIQEFEELQKESILYSNTKADKIMFHMLFNIADIGGQPAFLEMLPSLTIGPALYLVFMKLLEGLKTRYPAAFKCKDNRGTKLCQNYTYTSEEVIFTALSSIACFGNSDEEVEMYVANQEDRKQTTSLALLIGTHADKIEDPDKFAEIDEELRQHITETEFYTEGLIHSQKFLKVNNYSAADEEIREHRQLLEDILTVKFRQYDIPARWLMLSICLKLLAKNQGTHEVSFDDCVEIGKHFQMSKEMVKIALQFLHKYIGLVMYFPNHPNLKNVVICDPQAVFTSISELIFKIYDPTNLQVTEAQHDHFVQTGCFSPQDVKPVGKDQQTQGKLLSIATLIDLLVHLNIAAEVTRTESALEENVQCFKEKSEVGLDETIPEAIGEPANAQSSQGAAEPQKRRKYLFPAVLQTADLASLELKKPRGAYGEQLPEPICIRFKTGYMPLGFVCALSAKLLAEPKFQLIFKEDSENLTYKNLLKFRYKGRYNILLISGPKYCELQVTRHSGNADFWNKECCPQIRKTICDAADSVIRSMKYGSLYTLSKGYELAFKCPQHPDAEIGHEPLAKLVYDSTTQARSVPRDIQCVKSTCGTSLSLTSAMKMWFGEALPDIPLEINVKPSLKGNLLKVTAKGSNPLTFQWFKDEEPLTDSASYSGSTTEELVIERTDSELKGAYKCQVTDRKDTSKWSGEIEFDPFAWLLQQKGLKEKEAKKLVAYGYESMEDLKDLELDNSSMEKVGLTEPEIKRVRNFFRQEFVNTEGGSEEPSSSSEFCRDLIHTLHDLQAHWYLLGIQLEVNHPALEVIRRKGRTKECFKELITTFLACKHSQPKATLVDALSSCCIDRSYLIKKVEDLSFEQAVRKGSESERSSACRLKRVLNTIWGVYANWHNLADELISTEAREAIERDHSNVGDRFAALLNKHLEGDQDPGLKDLLAALRSPTLGRNDIANKLERALEGNEVW